MTFLNFEDSGRLPQKVDGLCSIYPPWYFFLVAKAETGLAFLKISRMPDPALQLRRVMSQVEGQGLISGRPVH